MTLATDTFTWVSGLVRQRSAIMLETGKEYLVESRLLPLARAAGSTDVDAYVRGIRQAGSPKALEQVVEALTTNETSWFRDAQPFQALSRHILPQIEAQRPGGVVKVWSAACSSGQEPYSVAMALEPLVAARRLEILGTDLNQQMVDRARAGRYNQLEVNRGLPAPMLVKYFTRNGPDWEVAPELRGVTRFARHNLLDAPPAAARSTWCSCATCSSTSTCRPSATCCAGSARRSGRAATCCSVPQRRPSGSMTGGSESATNAARSTDLPPGGQHESTGDRRLAHHAPDCRGSPEVTGLRDRRGGARP